jgi:DNA-binding MltR family transcriptional regulator
MTGIRQEQMIRQGMAKPILEIVQRMSMERQGA